MIKFNLHYFVKLLTRQYPHEHFDYGSNALQIAQLHQIMGTNTIGSFYVCGSIQQAKSILKKQWRNAMYKNKKNYLILGKRPEKMA